MRTVQLIALTLLTSACFAPEVAIEPRFTQVNISGDIAIANGAITADNDVEDVGIEDDSSAFGLRGDFKWGAPHLTLDLQTSTHDGDGVLEADLSQSGVTITAGTAVETDMNLGMHAAYLTFDLVPGDLELGLGFGVALVDLDFKTLDPLGGLSISEDTLIPVPMLAGRAGIEVGPIDLEALVGAMAYDDGDTDVTVFDGHVTGRYRILGNGDRLIGSLVGGLRYVTIDAEYEDGGDDVAGDLEVMGPFIGMRLQF